MSLAGKIRKLNSYSGGIVPDWVAGDYVFQEGVAGAAVHFGVDDTGVDAKFFADTSGAYVLWDESADEMLFNAAKVRFSGDLGTADHLIDFSDVTMPDSKNLIRGGSYSSPIAYTAASMGLLQLYAKQTRDTGVDVITFFYGQADGNAGFIGDSALVESSAASPGPKTLEGGQFMAGLRSGAYLASAAGDATAGMYGAWCKVYSAADSVASSGCKVAAIWLDNQMSCAIGGVEYTIYSTTGGTVPDAWARLETSSSGWAALFSFEASMAPLSTLACGNTASDSSIIIDIDGATKYIPVFDTAS